MPKGRDIGLAMCDYIKLMWQENSFLYWLFKMLVIPYRLNTLDKRH